MAVPRFNPFLDFLLHPHVGQIVSRPSSFQPFFFFFVFKTFDVGAIASPQQIGNSEDNIQFSSTNHIVVVVLHVTPVTTKCHRRRQKNRVQLWQFRLVCLFERSAGLRVYPISDYGMSYRFDPRAAERPRLRGQPALSSRCCHHLIRFFPFLASF